MSDRLEVRLLPVLCLWLANLKLIAGPVAKVFCLFLGGEQVRAAREHITADFVVAAR